MSSQQPVSMSRRSFLHRTAGAASALALGGRAAYAQGSERPPNVLLIISDDQHWSDYSFLGHEHIRTPRIDKLASQSLVFTRGYVTAPLCCPSLASMITGLHPHQHKITSNDPPFIGGERGWPQIRLSMRQELIAHIDHQPTLPGLLKQKDFQSLQTGKWWLGHWQRGEFTAGMTHGDPDEGGRHGDVGLDIGRKTMQPLYDFIDGAGDEPFFIWYAPMLPHLPHDPPQRLIDKYADKTDSEFVARYWASVEWWDETVGDLLDYLDESGHAADTIVLYVCDNGWIQDPESRVMLPRSKNTPYEGGVRTPVMVRWPGRLAPAMDEQTLVSSVDLAPTILDACGLDVPGELPGLNLLDRQALAQRAYVPGAAYSHNAVDLHNPLANLQHLWVLEGEWKLIVPAGLTPADGAAELYNVAQDPAEEKNLAGEHPERIEVLMARLHDWWPEAAKTAVVDVSL